MKRVNYFLLFAMVVAATESQVAPVRSLVGQSLSISAHSVSVTRNFHLLLGDVVSVTARSDDPNFSVDLFVYDGSHALAGKDNPDSTSTVFNWAALAEDDYYVLVRNGGAESGQVVVDIRHGKAPTISSPPNYDIERVFFATNRAPIADGSAELRFGTEPDDKHSGLRYGECAVSMPRSHEMGELEGPAILTLEFRADPEKHVAVLNTVSKEPPQFFSRVRRDVQRSLRKQLFVFIHGFNTSFEDAIRRTAQLKYDLGFDGPAITYSWPSQASATQIGYNMDSINAERAQPNLEVFLLDLVRESGASTIHLVAHSMGNRPLLRALEQIAHSGHALKAPAFDQVALMAPDLDREVFRQLATVIRPTAQRITLYASSRDSALKISERYAGYPRAGEGGSRIVIIPGIDSVDSSRIDTSFLGLGHQYYADSGVVLSDLYSLLRDIPPMNRFGLTREARADGVYWEFKARSR